MFIDWNDNEEFLLSISLAFVFSDKTMEGHKIKTKSKFKVRHQKHKLFRANEPLLSVLMWGVNFTVSNESHAFHRMIC